MNVPIETLIVSGLLGLASLAVLTILAIWLFKLIVWTIKKLLGIRPVTILIKCPHCAEETAEGLPKCQTCGLRLL